VSSIPQLQNRPVFRGDNDVFVDRWGQRFGDERLAGLFSRHAGREARILTLQLETRILEWTVKRKPRDGSTRWSTRKLGERLSVSQAMIARVWRKHSHKPRRLDPVLPLSPGRAERHAKVRLRLTPTYPSWLNQVELWFAKIERDAITRRVFTSVPGLKRTLMRHIRRCNQAPKTVKWKYFDPTRRSTSTSGVTVHQFS